ENIDIAATEIAKNPLEVSHVTHGVSVNSSDPCVWIDFAQIGFDTLGAFTDKLNVFASAFAAFRRRLSRLAAIVTKQALHSAMVRHRHTAGIALKREAAMPA